jgi:hypothetical protein
VEDLVAAVAGDGPNGSVERTYDVGNYATAEQVAPAVVDRGGAIRALGIVQVVLGGLLSLLVLFVIVSAVVSSKPPVLVAGAVYALPAANLLAMGIGSLKLAPWARLGTLISAGVWLGLGLMAAVGLLVASRLQLGMSRHETALAGVVIVPIMLIWVALPIVLIIVYTRPRARAAFARRTV